LKEYEAGFKNFFPYHAIVDHLFLYMDVDSPPEPAAEGKLEGKLLVYNLELWEQLKKYTAFATSKRINSSYGKGLAKSF
jgi:hypothetical protein